MANEPDIPPQDETVTLPVVQESLHVGTRPADTGRGVRVRKHVRSQPHEVDQTVWHDELDVRHVPVDRVVSAPPAARYEGDTFIVPVLEEVLVVEKRYRIKEELHITRLRRAGRHRQTVPLRAEHVTVERFDDGNGGPSPLTKEATMTHTLAAIFEHRGDADRAKAELINAGFSGSAVRLASGAGTQTQADTGPGADDSIGGSIMHFFNSLFGTDDNADKHYYSSAVNRGNTVLTVDAASDDEIDRASGIIEGFGPLNIEEQQGLSAQAPPPAYQGAAGSLQDAGTATAGMQAASPAGAMQGGQSAAAGSMQRATTEQQAIPVVQEELKVGKRTVQRGGVRVFQRVIETPVQQDVTLREEHVTVERRPVDQAIHPDQVPAFQEKTF
ncbi:MAG TPA: YsnF/AvaK domain-containing protein, partial [Duganella sp.]|uniref:YsnF/AvaK domain-containing protein n=1 Tax=Duganella sp. TaxID=1904440 RepID=UPI002ED09953